MKALGMRTVSTSNLAKLRGNLDESAKSTAAGPAKVGSVRVVGKRESSASSAGRPILSYDRRYAIQLQAASHFCNFFDSLQRRRKSPARSVAGSFAGAAAMAAKRQVVNERGLRRAKSLELMLAGSPMATTSTSAASSSSSTASSTASGPHYAKSAILRSAYCTIDRARLRKRASIALDDGCLTLPRTRKGAYENIAFDGRALALRAAPPPKPPRTRSLDLLEDDDLPLPPPPPEQASTPMMSSSRDVRFMGDFQPELDALRRAASAKTVTIHPDVTEFHYPGKKKNSFSFSQ